MMLTVLTLRLVFINNRVFSLTLKFDCGVSEILFPPKGRENSRTPGGGLSQTHLIIPQPDQNDVWRVDPDLRENKNKRQLCRSDLCDLHTIQWAEPRGRCVKVLVGTGFYLFPEFSSDVAEPLGSVKAHGLQAAVPQHLDDLSVLWNTFNEHSGTNRAPYHRS